MIPRAPRGVFRRGRGGQEAFLWSKAEAATEAGDSLALLVGDGRRVDPGILVVQTYARRFGINAQALDGRGGFGERCLRGAGIAARNVQRFRDTLRDAFEQRLGFDQRADFLAETGKYLLRVVGIAVEPSVHSARTTFRSYRMAIKVSEMIFIFCGLLR
jgi:hypothetical protein